MDIDPKSNSPIYKQIVAEIRSAIGAGVYKPGECLPSLRALAIEIQVNPNTVQRAYDELEREGVLVSRRGVGVFVTDREQLSANDGVERRAARAFRDAIRSALRDDIAIDRLRSLFEEALNQSRAAREIKKP